MNEAPIVMFINYKRSDNFEVSLTFRGEILEVVATNLNNAIKQIIKAGGTPISRQRQAYPPKVIEYVENRVCPVDSAKLIYATKKDGSRYIKCENNKWDKTLNQATGCVYVEWNDLKNKVEQSFAKKEEEPTVNIDEDINF